MPVLITKEVDFVQKPVKYILTVFFITWLIAGTLDAIAAIFILAKGNATGVFVYIANATFGMQAFGSRVSMITTGVAVHYFIAGCFTAFYFLAYPYIPFLKKNIYWDAALYGVFVYTVMLFFVDTLSRLAPGHFNIIQAIENAVILIFTIGLPNAWLRRRI